MQHVRLSREYIRELTGQTFFDRGQRYFNNKKVYGLSFNPQTNAWRGLVKGTKIYTVWAYLHEDGTMDTTCSCPAYASHSTCKHIAAVLLAISDDSVQSNKRFAVDKTKNAPIEQETDLFAKQLLYSFRRRNNHSVKAKSMLKVEYLLEVTGSPKNALSIEMRIGEHRPYIIRDIREFLKAFQKQEDYRVNQSFTYEPSTHLFPKEDRDMVELLLMCQTQENLFGHTYFGRLDNPRALLVPPVVSDKLLEKLQHTDFIFKNNYTQSSTIKMKELTDQLDFQLDFHPSSNVYSFEFADLSDYILLSSYRYLLLEDTFFQLTENQNQILERLMRVLPFRDKRKHIIAPQEMDNFSHDVMPFMEQVGKIDMTERMTKQINHEPLQIKIYLHEVDEILQASVEFHYGETVIHALTGKKNSSEIVRRKTTEEEHIIQLLQDMHFIEINGSMQLFSDEAIYEFLFDRINEVNQYAEIFISDSVQRLLTDKPIHINSNVDYVESEGMLDIQFSMEGISQEEIHEIFRAITEKRRYYRLQEGPLVKLEGETFDTIRQLQKTLALNADHLVNGQMKVPAARSFQVEDLLDAARHHYTNTFRKMLEQLKDPASLEFELPANLNADMRDYQVTGYQWMKTLSHYHLGGILADDMGLGKTLQTISYLLSEANAKNGPYQALVVAPSSLLYNWKKEIEKFSPSLNVQVISGSKPERRTLVENSKEAEVLITSYPTIRKDTDLYEDIVFDCIVLDEAQAIKNHLTLTAKSIRSLHARQFFALSGTPIENKLDELWSIFYTISPGLFGNKKEFTNYDPSYIAKITRPFILRRIKRDVLHELPEKIETVQYSELTKQQKELYVGYTQRIRDELDVTIQEKGFERGKLQILAGLTRLRQICCHPNLFIDNYGGTSGKLEQLLELVAELKTSGSRALIFSQFSTMLSLLKDKLEDEGYNVFYLDGSTPSKDRMDMADAFNSGEKDFFLISLKAGGTGLNLTGADTVILYDLWWNPAVEEQAAGRAHRIGQKKVVQVIRMISEGTIEEKIYQLQQKKRELVDQIIQPGETLLSTLSEKEIREIIQLDEKKVAE
ncbi:SNF2 family DNA or RNA helicase [Gracilibacillus halotolerans]|uniref:SNF2 family DNA or RNA helicase n=1 Tax=Gracilibacillus halotolerans TaxID=74386 RepID=A0A841RMZ3_9BACI|nr:DEAD/DEAH box helicase [Gracilibacillus halotolerans]MBB6512314.1 SNF2 family DNA or RNA helicase [Gracilibacillus halotolerans]